MNPVFVHDSDCCTFLGHEVGHDLYYCPQNGLPTLIARYGSIGPDYNSCPVYLVAKFSIADRLSPFDRAYQLAEKAGLIEVIGRSQ